VFDVVVGQRVVPKQCGFIAWQIEERGLLALCQYGAMRHVSFAFIEAIICICL
jgi:hypothetical protein